MFLLHFLKHLQRPYFLLVVWLEIFFNICIYFIEQSKIVRFSSMRYHNWNFICVLVVFWDVWPFYDLCRFSLCWFWTLGFAVSDYYQFDELLTPEEQALKKKVRECIENEVAPIMTKVFSAAKFFIFSVLLSTFYVLLFCEIVANMSFFSQCIKLLIEQGLSFLILLHRDSDISSISVLC